jgi:MerR family mercuric resistance operon transcriptional regulator
MLGFSLKDIAGLLNLDGPQTCSVTHDLALAKLHLVQDKIADLEAIRDALQQMVRQCELKQKRGTCPIIATLVEDER